MRELIVTTKSKKDKGRSFRASLLSFITADSLWPGGEAETNNIRPVWAMLAGSDNQLKAFMANLTTGRKAEELGNSSSVTRYEFLKTAGYRTVYQKTPAGSIATVFLPDLFRIDPGLVDPKGIQFVMVPTKEWVQSQKIDGQAILRHVTDLGYGNQLPEGFSPEELVVAAHLFAAYLDRRTRCPLVSDGRFFLQLMLSCIKNRRANVTQGGGYYSRYYSTTQYGLDDVGLMPAVTFNTTHSDFEELAAREVAVYFDAIKG